MISRFNLIPVVAALMFSALTIPGSFAGAGSGGGGNAVVCFDNSSIPERIRQERDNSYMADTDIPHITKVEILDLYQARENGKKLIEAKPGETIDQYTQRLLSRFTELVPAVQEMVDQGRKALAVHQEFPDGLDAIEDVGLGENVNTRDCVRVTIIGQYDRDGGFIGYDPRIFKLPDTVFSTTSKALSWLHEQTYWVARQNGATTSDTTREVIGAMISEDETIYDLEDRLYKVLGYNEDFLGDFTQDYKKDLIDSQIISGEDGGADYFQKGGLFQSDEDLKKECTEKATAQLVTRTLARYNQVWRPKLFALKYIPMKTLQLIDSLFQRLSLDVQIEHFDSWPVRSACNVKLLFHPYIGNPSFQDDHSYDLNFALPL